MGWEPQEGQGSSLRAAAKKAGEVRRLQGTCLLRGRLLQLLGPAWRGPGVRGGAGGHGRGDRGGPRRSGRRIPAPLPLLKLVLLPLLPVLRHLGLEVLRQGLEASKALLDLCRCCRRPRALRRCRGAAQNEPHRRERRGGGGGGGVAQPRGGGGCHGE